MLCALLVLSYQFPVATFTIDTTSSTPISPYIYGANHPNWKELAGVPFTLARQGGNRASAYNWETNASNAGNDWHHQNDGYMGETDEPGWMHRSFLNDAQTHNAAVLLTVPTTGYVSADKKGDGDVNKTPNYLETRFHKSMPKKGPAFEYPPNTRDRFVYQDEFVAYIEKQKSKRTPLWFSLDNEPDLWHSTHQRIHPTNLTYAQIIANNIDYAAAIKAVAPGTLIFGPANYGWQGFRRFQSASDANNRDFLDVYLAAMKEADRKLRRRLVDVLDIHWYPEARGDGVRIAWGEDKPGTPAARIQAPRSLWDPTYVEDSWIAETLNKKPIALLPGVLAQIAKHYPGTKLGITEYNYGGGKHISGALAQADVLGLFGRYRVFAAAHWGVNKDEIAQLAAFRSYLNFDGKGAKFGDLSLPVTGGAASDNSVFAARDGRASNRVTLVAINKKRSDQAMTFNLRGFIPKTARAFVVTSTNLSAPVPHQVLVTGSSVTMNAPAESVVTIEALR